MTATSKPFVKAKRAVLRALRLRKIATVEIEYDGEGDNGQIGSIRAINTKQRRVLLDEPAKLAFREGETPTRYGSLHEALDDFAWTLLAEIHGGFENDGGGFGTLMIDVAGGTITLDHNDRFTDVVSTTTEV